MKRLGWIKLTLIIVLLTGFLIRIYQIESVSNQFHVTRQFYTAQMVRGDYFASIDVPEWRRAISRANQPPSLEPPFIQTVALIGYKLTGSEQIWIPRAFSALMWMISGYFLFLAAKIIMREEAALVTVVFYMFIPFGIVSSRTFQANPTMIALSVITYFAVLRYFEQPSPRRLFWAIISAASANWVMIYAAFSILPLFAWLSIQRHGFRHVFSKRDTWLFVFFSLLPVGLYYFDGLFISGYLLSQTGSLFKPHLWLTAIFWINWAAIIVEVIGIAGIILSLQAVVTTRMPLQSATIRSLWLGYIIFGIIFNWPIMSHSYYSMPLIPVAALSIGSVLDFIIIHLKTTRQQKLIPVIALGVVAVLCIYGLATYLPTTSVSSELAKEIPIAQEIGNKLQHSSHTVFLAKDYGSYLKFYGEIAGANWPMTWDFNAERASNKSSQSVEQRLEEITNYGNPHYFIITDFDEYERQNDLMQYLMSHFAILEKTPDYIIYDLLKSVRSVP